MPSRQPNATNGRRSNQRSPEAKAWRHLYDTAHWERLRRAKLAADPLCERCGKLGLVVVADVANHVIPHKGDLVLFYDPANLSSLCAPCHDGPVQREERTGKPSNDVGYSIKTGLDGLPIDRRHPFYGGSLT